MNQKDASNRSCQPQSRWATRSSMLADLRGFSEQRWIAFEMVYKPLLLFWIRKKNVPSNGVDDVLQDSWISVAKGIELKSDISKSQRKYVSARRTFRPPSDPDQAPHFSTAVNTCSTLLREDRSSDSLICLSFD